MASHTRWESRRHERPPSRAVEAILDVRELIQAIAVLRQVVEQIDVQTIAPKAAGLRWGPPEPEPAAHLFHQQGPARGRETVGGQALLNLDVTQWPPVHHTSNLQDRVGGVHHKVLVAHEHRLRKLLVLSELVVHCHVLVVDVHGGAEVGGMMPVAVAILLPSHVVRRARLVPLLRGPLDAIVPLTESRVPRLQRGERALDHEKHRNLLKRDAVPLHHLIERRSARGDV
eukprot:UN1113